MKNDDYRYKKIAYLGIPGSYSFMATQKFFRQKKIMLNQDSFADIFTKVEKDQTQFGVIPLENSTTGSIYETYDLLVNSNLKIVAEIILRIKQCLLVKPEISGEKEAILKRLKFCYSHPEAIKQCRSFFSRYPKIKPIYVRDTASSVKELKEGKNLLAGAIASRQAAKIYHLKILTSEIQDNPHNFTRFVAIAKKGKKVGNKVSLIFSVEHKPGSLFKTLEPYARLGLNLTKIESRPVVGRPWEYIFFVDFEIDGKEKELALVLEQMKEHVNFLKVLGRYWKGKIYET